MRASDLAPHRKRARIERAWITFPNTLAWRADDPILYPTKLSAPEFSFTIQRYPDAVVRLWSSTELNSWSLLGTLTNTTGTTNFTDSAASGTSKFYKARYV